MSMPGVLFDRIGVQKPKAERPVTGDIEIRLLLRRGRQ